MRGETRKAKKDGIYRASLRGDFTYVRAQAEAVAAELLKGNARIESGKPTLIETRRKVERGWQAASNVLADQGQGELAAQARRFVDQMPRLQTERELVADAILNFAKESPSQSRTPPVR